MNSNEIRLLLQGGIRECILDFKLAGMHEKEDLNTLLAFYRAMHTMSINAMMIERKLSEHVSRKTNGLFREFGAGIEVQLPTAAAEENSDLQLARGNADGIGDKGEERSPEPSRQSGNPYLILHFGRSKDDNMVQQSEQ